MQKGIDVTLFATADSLINGKLHLIRKRQRFTLDASRVITKFFAPASEQRKEHILQRMLALPEEDCATILQEALEGFTERHRDFKAVLLKNYQTIEYWWGPRKICQRLEKCW